MAVPFLQSADFTAWIMIEIMLTSLFAVITTITVFVLSRRLHLIEQRRVYDLEDACHDDEPLKKFRDLQTTYSKKRLFDKKAFHSLMAHQDGKKFTLEALTEGAESTVSRGESLQILVEDLHLDGSESKSKKSMRLKQLQFCQMIPLLKQ
jgi:hypothetical protein